MIQFLGLFLIGFVNANVIKQDCITNFEEILIRENLNSPYQMSLDYDTNTLFFSESVEDEENESSKLSFLTLQTGKYRKISGITGGFASAVDKKNHAVYLGGKDGIFKYDFARKRAFYDGARNMSIWQLFYMDVLYFTTFPDEKAYRYLDKKYEKVPQLQDTRALLIGVSSRNNIYFSNSSGLFCYDNIDNKMYDLGDYNINSFSSDKDDYLYFSTPSAIYFINDIKRNVEQIITLPNIYGFVVENNNNILYAQEEKIVRLKFVNSTCITNLKLNN